MDLNLVHVTNGAYATWNFNVPNLLDVYLDVDLHANVAMATRFSTMAKLSTVARNTVNVMMALTNVHHIQKVQ